jgi:hypothetical protein
MWVFLRLTFRRNVSPPYSGRKDCLLVRDSFHSEDGDGTFLRNIGSNKRHTGPHPRIWDSSYSRNSYYYISCYGPLKVAAIRAGTLRQATVLWKNRRVLIVRVLTYLSSAIYRMNYRHSNFQNITESNGQIFGTNSTQRKKDSAHKYLCPQVRGIVTRM